MVASFWSTFASSWSNYSDSIFVSAIIIAGALAAFFTIRYFLRKAAKSLNLGSTQVKGITSIVKLVIILIAITGIIFQFSAMSGIAASAISVAAGTVIGFSSRNTISNAIAGILLLSSRPFKIGDRIRTTEDDSMIGDVIEISIIYTKIRTIRNELVTIPNQMLLENQIINYSGLDLLSTSVEVSVGYEADKELIKALLIEAAKRTEGIISKPPPFVLITRFDNFAAVYELRAYTNRPNEYLQLESAVRENIYQIFQREQIDLTTPNILTHLDDKKMQQENQAGVSSKEGQSHRSNGEPRYVEDAA